MYHASLQHFEVCGGLIAWRGRAGGGFEVVFLGWFGANSANMS
jgi:hypothetical protein